MKLYNDKTLLEDDKIYLVINLSPESCVQMIARYIRVPQYDEEEYHDPKRHIWSVLVDISEDGGKKSMDIRPIYDGDTFIPLNEIVDEVTVSKEPSRTSDDYRKLVKRINKLEKELDELKNNGGIYIPYTPSFPQSPICPNYPTRTTPEITFSTTHTYNK